MTGMNAALQHTFTAVRGADLSPGQDWRIVTRVYGGLLGTEYLICFDDRYFRIGELTVQLLNRGTHPSEIDALEVDPDGEPVEYPEADRKASEADAKYQRAMERV
jgi:hypothetical protein